VNKLETGLGFSRPKPVFPKTCGINWDKPVFPGIYREILGKTGKYWEKYWKQGNVFHNVLKMS